MQADKAVDTEYTGSGKVTIASLHMGGITVSGTGSGSPPPSVHIKGTGKFPEQAEKVEIDLSWVEDGKEISGKAIFQIIPLK